MSGYTPLFASLTRGTLCGKWPDIGLWPVLLSMTDWRGEIDATQQYIATVTGLSLDEVSACIERFCQPDHRSRSEDENGARLVLIDPSRDWGWRVVNIQKYRDRASGRDQVADGRNAEKVRRYKSRQTPGDTGGHRGTPVDTHSYSDSNTNKDSERRRPVDKSSHQRKAINIASSEKPRESPGERAQSREAMQRVLDRAKTA